MITDALARQGGWLFRWRSYLPLVLIPLACLTIASPEPVETYFGEAVDDAYELACVTLAFVGLGVRCLTVGYVPAGTSGRNTQKQVAHSLNTTGVYSLTRNPLYLGNAITYIAMALFTQSVYFLLLVVLLLVIYLERVIAAEERFLAERFGDAYRSWAKEVPAFFPRVSGWQAPELPFSWKNVLKREYSGLFAIVVTFVALDYSRDLFAEGETGMDAELLIPLILGALAYIVLRSLKRHTRLLNVEGR
jgi:protein-S-isoprenylcysteine O-methyltransferase Ste14